MVSKQSPTIVLAAGGSGGHVFPAIAFAEYLQEKGYHVLITTDGRGKKFLKNKPNLPILVFKIPSPHGSIVAKIRFIVFFCLAFFKTIQVLKDSKYAFVWGFGGYPMLPTMVAAWVLRKPRSVHQSDVILGKANRFFAPFSDGIALGQAQTLQAFHHQTSFQKEVTGNPVRTNLLAYQNSPYPQRSPQDPFYLLVLGGSQGSRFWGNLVPEAMKLLPTEVQKLFIIRHQCRPETLGKVEEAYRGFGGQVHLTDFIYDMGLEMQKCHLALTRGGAMTLTELGIVGRPAFIVPLDAVPNDHQWRNAKELAKRGAVWHRREREMTPDVLAEYLHSFLQNPILLENAAKKALESVEKDGSQRLLAMMQAIYTRRKGVSL